MLSGGGVRGRGAPSAFLHALVNVAVSDPRRPGSVPMWKKGGVQPLFARGEGAKSKKTALFVANPIRSTKRVLLEKNPNNKIKRAIAL